MLYTTILAVVWDAKRHVPFYYASSGFGYKIINRLETCIYSWIASFLCILLIFGLSMTWSCFRTNSTKSFCDPKPQKWEILQYFTRQKYRRPLKGQLAKLTGEIFTHGFKIPTETFTTQVYTVHHLKVKEKDLNWWMYGLKFWLYFKRNLVSGLVCSNHKPVRLEHNLVDSPKLLRVKWRADFQGFQPHLPKMPTHPNHSQALEPLCIS